MGLFDRFKKKQVSAPAENASPNAPQSEWPQPPAADTMCLLLMDRLLDSVEPAVALLRSAFGENAVGGVDDSHPRVPAVTVTVDGLEFWVSYLPMPVPPDSADIPTAARYSFLLSDEEKQAFISHKSFWMLAQKSGGKTLAEKRRVCWAFSRLISALMGLDGAVGINPINRGGLLVSKRHCLQQRELMEGKSWDNADGFFPVPLWVWVYGTTGDGDKPTIQTTGLKDFGLPELGFFDPQREVKELLDLLYSMSCLQITGKQLYRNMALVPLDEKTEVVCKQDGETLFFIGA